MYIINITKEWEKEIKNLKGTKKTVTKGKTFRTGKKKYKD